MALLLIDVYTLQRGVATGDQIGTLFSSTSGSTSPVVFSTPQFQSTVSARDATGTGHGLDQQGGVSGSAARERLAG